MFKPGSIRKVEVNNFVTYSHVELYPGPQLNLIIGPNGTGKSTIVAAIILGLGGNPKIVGRGHKLSEYVKHGCDSACINIFLHTAEKNKLLKITRQFDFRDKSVWKLNDQNATMKQVLDCITEYNIQVDNLCQFLPQDRVQDFAKLNKQELLRETQKALCMFELIEKQENLIESRSQHNNLHDSMEKHVKMLREAEQANALLEGRVQCFNKKKEFDSMINNIERKIAWQLYEALKDKLIEIKSDKTKAQQVYDRYKDTLKPTEQAINQLKKEIAEKQQERNSTLQQLRDIEGLMNDHFEKQESLRSKIRNQEDELSSQLAEMEQWLKEIETAKKKLEEMKKLQQEISEKSVTNAKLKQTLSAEIHKLSCHQKTLQNKKEDILQTKQDSYLQRRAFENEISGLEDVKKRRLQYLERTNPDTFKAVNWLENNRHLFEEQIYDPMMLEINVLNPNHSKYVENVVSQRDRLAFTCVNKNDMRKLIKCLRETHKLSVNVIHSNCTEDQGNMFQPVIPIEQLRKYGFYTYVNNLFAAPGPIMHYLCKTYNLHNIPIGDRTTDECYDTVPKQIRCFFGEKNKYVINYSKYTNAKTTKLTQVYSDGALSFSMDIVKLDGLKANVQDIQRQMQKYDEECSSIESQSSRIQEKIEAIRDRFKEIQKEQHNLTVLNNRVSAMEAKIQEIQGNMKSPDALREEFKTKVRGHLKGIETVQMLIKRDYEKFCQFTITSELQDKKIEVLRRKVAYMENTIIENKAKLQEAEHQLNIIKDKYNEVMGEAKSLQSKAKAMSNGYTPADDGFEEFIAEYERLPSNIDELRAMKEEYLSRIACLNIADDGELQEYEDRQTQMKYLAEQIEKANVSRNKLGAKIDRMQEEWLTRLKEVVGQINARFSRAFQAMGCAGEVSVCTGQDEKDYSQYGISIKVTYRNGEPLQELNSNIQSGGERAVATAAYMLSLQELTPVPFRCVDEINQGMDANNERRIFDLVVECTCQPDSSQYFLITPKLIPNLNYSENMKVHIVHNGPFIEKDRKWGFSKLCNPDGVQI